MRVIVEGFTQVPEGWSDCRHPTVGLAFLLELMRPTLLRLAECGVRPGDVIRLSLERAIDSEPVSGA